MRLYRYIASFIVAFALLFCAIMSVPSIEKERAAPPKTSYRDPRETSFLNPPTETFLYDVQEDETSDEQRIYLVKGWLGNAKIALDEDDYYAARKLCEDQEPYVLYAHKEDILNYNRDEYVIEIRSFSNELFAAKISDKYLGFCSFIFYQSDGGIVIASDKRSSARLCPDCEGNGITMLSRHVCPRCGGSGEEYHTYANGGNGGYVGCPKCGGMGYIAVDYSGCEYCNGFGYK